MKASTFRAAAGGVRRLSSSSKSRLVLGRFRQLLYRHDSSHHPRSYHWGCTRHRGSSFSSDPHRKQDRHISSSNQTLGCDPRPSNLDSGSVVSSSNYLLGCDRQPSNLDS